jgi:hypothetical protein
LTDVVKQSALPAILWTTLNRGRQHHHAQKMSMGSNLFFCPSPMQVAVHSSLKTPALSTQIPNAEALTTR